MIYLYFLYCHLSSVASSTARSPFQNGLTTQYQNNVRSMIKNIEFKFGRAFDEKSTSTSGQSCFDPSSFDQNEMIQKYNGENNSKDLPHDIISIPIVNKGSDYESDSNIIEISGLNHIHKES